MFLNDSPCKRDLKGLVGGNIGGELGERLLATASDSDEQGVAFRHADYARDLDKVHDGVLEESSPTFSGMSLDEKKFFVEIEFVQIGLLSP